MILCFFFRFFIATFLQILRTIQVLFGRDGHPVHGVVQRLRRVLARGRPDQPARRVDQHLRHARQLQVPERRRVHPLPQQVRPALRQAASRQLRPLHERLPWQSATPRRRQALPGQQVLEYATPQARIQQQQQQQQRRWRQHSKRSGQQQQPQR